MRFFGPVRFLHSALFLVFAITVVTTSRTLAEESGWPLDGPSFSASPTEIVSAAAKVEKEKFADVTVLFEEARYVLDGAGRLKETHRLVYRLETPAGVESWSTASVQWEPWYQNKPQIHARVLQSDGRVTELDQKTLTDVPAKNEGDGTFEDARIHKAPLPALTVGAIVEQETVLVDKEPFFNGGGVYRNYFYRNVPIARSRLVVEAPVGVPLQYQVKDLPDLAPKREEKEGVQRLTFDQSRLKARGGSDIQLATHDPKYGRVEFSTGKSWKSVVAAYLALAEPQMQQAQVKGVTATAVTGSREEVIQALVSRLHRDVRYTGVEFGRAKLTPQTPAEVLKRHYGDCKDKAALLVTMLREKGIAANLALLNMGPGEDVTPELPGMNQFDHAIVYLPADAKGHRALWIDATAEYTRVGDLPYVDQDRLALIVAEGTKELTRTPLPKAENNVVVENRLFRLKEFGPANVVELSETRGDAEADYRSWYGGVESKDFKSNMERYAKTAYLAKSVTKIEHSDGKDFSKPFTLRLEMAEAKRGSSDLDEAVVAVSPTGVLDRLPKWFATDPKQGQEKETAEQKEEREREEAQRSGEYDVQPQVTEWRYEIVPTIGFALRALPEDKATKMGPATLTQRYSVDKTGTVSAVVRFETSKPRYSTEEVLALRKGVLDAYQSNFVMVIFDQTGAKLLADGKIREALDADRALMESHPNEALHYSALANALLKAGVGDKAREEAKKATELEPKSAQAHSTLAWVLQHNSIGVRFGKGFDLPGAVAAYQKAVELDPDNTDYRVNLAILLEFDPSGDRYGSAANLPQAISVYRALRKQDEAVGKQYEDNLLFSMLYSHQYKEVLDEIATLPTTPVRNGIAITATVAKEGVAAGLKRADQISGGARESGNGVAHRRRSTDTTAVVSAGG